MEPVDVDPRDVAALLDRHNPPVQQAIAVVTELARAYTRGGGFIDGDPLPDVAAVITTASARLAANGGGLPYSTTVGHRTTTFQASFQGFTLLEQIVLNRYRRRAM